MSFKLPDIVGFIKADNSQYKNTLKDTKQVTGTTTSTMTKAFLAAQLAMKGIGIAVDLVGRGLSGLGDIIMSGAELERLELITARIGKNLDVGADEIAGWRKELEDANTTGSKAEKVIQSFLRTGLYQMTDELSRGKEGTEDYSTGFKAFALTVKDFGAAMGISSGNALDMVSKAIVRQDTAALESLGIQINLTKVWRDNADELDNLSGKERTLKEQQLLMNEVMRQGTTVFGAYDEVNKTAGKNLLSVQDAFQTFKEQLGKGLQPVFKIVTASLLGLTKGIRDLATWMEPLVNEVFTKLGEKLGPIVERVTNFAKGIAQLVAGIVFAIQTGDAWNDIIGEAGKSMGLSKEQVRDFMGRLQTFVDETLPNFIKEFKRVFNIVKDFFQKEWKTIVITGLVIGIAFLAQWAIAAAAAAVSTIVAMAPVIAVIAAIALAVKGLMILWENDWNGIQEKTRAVVEWFKTNTLPILQNVFRVLGQVFQWLVQNIFIPYIQKIIFSVKLWINIFKWLWGVIWPIVQFISKAVIWLVENVIAPMVAKAVENIKILAKIWSWLYTNIIEPIVKLIVSVILRNFQIIWGFIKAIFNKVVEGVKQAWGLIKTYIIDPLKAAFDWVMEHTEGARTFIKDVFNGIVEFLKGLKDKIINAIVEPFKKAKQEVENIAQGVKDAADKINPFHKESPSLVENVEAGIGQIMNAYRMLSGVELPLVAGLPEISPASVGLTPQSATQAREGGETQGGKGDTIINVDKLYGDAMGLRNFAGELKKEFNRMDVAQGGKPIKES